ncbi:MAG: hypothetical protein BRD46_04720 [Bacteroidetes bacterium QS_8_68_15]|nr:MAG: hypothetical protein BRD46_04720 [Bacteroidetes bacterium QS_8_68_15]
MNGLEALELAVAAVVGLASVGLAGRASRMLWRGAREDAHGTACASRRLWAHRMRLFAFTGLAAVGVGGLAAVRSGFGPGGLAAGGAWWWSVGMGLSGLLAWASARASGRASRRGDKRSHVRARIRFQRWGEQQRRRRERGQRGQGPSQRGRGGARAEEEHHRRRRQQHARAGRRKRQGQQQKVRRALRTLQLSAEATPEEIKRAWREHAFRHHPDRHSSAGDEARAQHAEAFREAKRAYETLREDDDANRR